MTLEDQVFEMLVAEDVEFFATSQQEDEAPYILPLTGGKRNPLSYFEPGNVGYVLRRLDQTRTRPTRVVWSSGPMRHQGPGSWGIGALWHLRHDQSGVSLGHYQVVGIVLYGVDGDVVRTVGEVPDMKLAGAVFK